MTHYILFMHKGGAAPDIDCTVDNLRAEAERAVRTLAKELAKYRVLEPRGWKLERTHSGHHMARTRRAIKNHDICAYGGS
jgi:hypothetical protein